MGLTCAPQHEISRHRSMSDFAALQPREGQKFGPTGLSVLLLSAPKNSNRQPRTRGVSLSGWPRAEPLR
jgi:hypothetical protein